MSDNIPTPIVKKKRGRKPKNAIQVVMPPNVDNLSSENIQNSEPVQNSESVPNSEHVKEKKKRGRKPKPKVESELGPEIKVQKRRGRKPKPKLENEEPKIPKKRGRKPKDKYGITDKAPSSLPSSEENIILHLPIKTKNLLNNQLIEEEILQYNPNLNEPKPFEPAMLQNNISLPFPLQENSEMNEKIIKEEPSIKMDICNVDKVQNIPEPKSKNKEYNDMLEEYAEKRDAEITTHITSDKSKNSAILIEYLESNKKKRWPSSTKLDCFWCCHSFDSFPFALPMKIVDNNFLVFGNFCSPECCAAYNFDSNDESDDIWERYSLLNILYKNDNLTIKLAPSRLTLKKFGGKLTIDEFRECNGQYHKDYKITLPPMVSIIPTMEETNYDISKKKHFVPLDRDRINKANQDLRLRRTKPLPDSKNTLESCMDLRYV